MNPLKNLEKILAHADEDFVQVKDFAEAFGLLTSVIADLKKALEAKMFDDKSEMNEGMKETHKSLMEMEKRMTAMMSSSEKTTSKHVQELSQRLMAEINNIKASIPTMPEMSVFEDKLARIEASIKNIEPEEIIDKLESISNENDKLSIEAIGYLREELDALAKKISKAKGITIFGGGGGSGGGRIVKTYDLSTQLDGVTKTFNLPAMWRVIDVKITHPAPLRPTVDYTWTTSTITFTSEIDAATYLSAGQSVIVIYAE